MSAKDTRAESRAKEWWEGQFKAKKVWDKWTTVNEFDKSVRWATQMIATRQMKLFLEMFLPEYPKMQVRVIKSVVVKDAA